MDSSQRARLMLPGTFHGPWGAIREGQYEDGQHLEFESPASFFYRCTILD